MNGFKTECGINEYLYQQLAKYGIVTLAILSDSIQCKDDLKIKYKIMNDNHRDLLWKVKQDYDK